MTALPEKLNLDCVVQRDPDIIAVEADRDIVMVSIANGLYYGVSAVAREIWEAIEQPKKISDLVDDLLGTFDIDRAKCVEAWIRVVAGFVSQRCLILEH